ncbi:MAG: hypothetical protein OHK0028_08980 [Deltaproteobacteria bacterium]
MHSFKANAVVGISTAAGGSAFFRMVRAGGGNGEAVLLGGSPLKEYFPGDRVNVVLEREESSLIGGAVVTEVRFPDTLVFRFRGSPEERPKREYARIEDFLCMEFEVWKGEESAVVERFRRSAPRKPPIQLTPPARFTQQDDRNVLEELEKEILKVIVGMDQKLDAVIKFLSGENRKALMGFANQWVNLSGSGMRFIVNEPVAEGDHLAVLLHLPDGGGVPVRLLGVVTRTQPPRAHAPRGGIEVGIRYRHIEEEDRDRIVRYIFSRQREAIRSGAEAKGGGKGVE